MRRYAHTTYKCCVKNCGMRFPMRIHLIVHADVEHGTIRYLVNYLGEAQGFTKQEAAIMRRGFTTCEYCLKQARLNSALQHVAKFHIADWKKRIKCPKCDFSAAHNSVMRKHMIRHGVIPYLCAICALPFASESALKTHEEVKHDQSQVTPCPECHKNFESTRALNSHVRKVHKRAAEYICHVCAFTTNQTTSLRLHIRTQHEEEHYYRHVCQLCGFATKQKCTLTAHYKKHHPHLWQAQKSVSGAITCELCGYEASHKHTYDYHMANHHSSKAVE